MKVSREQAALNRERVLDVAAQLFREKGFDGIGVADLMKSAGLTHGGFYGQFESKEDLAAQACARALSKTSDYWHTLIDKRDDPYEAMVVSYLSSAHRDKPGNGCALAALGAEAQRRGPALRQVFAEGANALLECLMRVMPNRSKTAKREQALVTMATLIGAQVLARAVDDAQLSKEILTTVKASLLAK
jgi:TetR/AcrR family transcriptional regulator, transcriptional repressor for nem operon